MKEIFSLRQTDRPVPEKYKLNLNIPSYNQVTFGRKAITLFGPKLGIVSFIIRNLRKVLRQLKQ